MLWKIQILEQLKSVALARQPLSAREKPRPMSRSPFMFILLLILGAVAVGLLALGAFPPHVPSQPVERTLPNDRFQTGR